MSNKTEETRSFDLSWWERTNRSAETPGFRGRPEALLVAQQFLWERRFSRFLRKAPFDLRRKELRQATGKMGICRWCGIALTGRRLSWCSDDCEGAYRIRLGGSSIRWVLERRDRGVCARCGVDSVSRQRRWRELSDLREDYQQFLIVAGTCQGYRLEWIANLPILRQQLRPIDPASRLAKKHPYRRNEPVPCDCPGCRLRQPPASWEAAHILAVAEGGGCSGPENYETLCEACHREDTKQLHQRLKGRPRGRISE